MPDFVEHFYGKPNEPVKDDPRCPHGRPLHQDCYLCDPYGDEEDYGDEDDALAEAEMNCHKHADGQCGAAGSEYCEFQCPFRDE